MYMEAELVKPFLFRLSLSCASLKPQDPNIQHKQEYAIVCIIAALDLFPSPGPTRAEQQTPNIKPQTFFRLFLNF